MAVYSWPSASQSQQTQRADCTQTPPHPVRGRLKLPGGNWPLHVPTPTLICSQAPQNVQTLSTTGKGITSMYSWCLALCLAQRRGWTNTRLISAAGRLMHSLMPSPPCPLGLWRLHLLVWSGMPLLHCCKPCAPLPGVKSRIYRGRSWDSGPEALEITAY